MKILGRDKLTSFLAKHTDARSWIRSWLAEVELARWKTPNELKDRYPKASILPNDRGIIFDVKGNDYRMHVRVNFQQGIVVVVQVGTHREYDKWTL